MVNALRDKGIKGECDHMGKSVKAQMKYANKIDAAFTIILGDNELEEGKAKLKRMEDGEQIDINLKDLDVIVKIVNGK